MRLYKYPKTSFINRVSHLEGRGEGIFILCPAVSQTPRALYMLYHATLKTVRQGVTMISFYTAGILIEVHVPSALSFTCKVLGLGRAPLAGYYHALMEQTLL